MLQASSILSLLFFSASVVYLFFGIYIIYLNPKASLNKLFLVVCMSLCLWSFGFSLDNSAPSMEIGLFWQRISAIGWTFIFGLMLHFFLLLTNHQHTLKRRWFCLLLYLPAMINLYVFSISQEMATLQYHLIRTDYGWVNIAMNTNNRWYLFFYMYSAGYALASLGIVWHWKRKSSGEQIQKQASLIFFSILSALLLESFTDVILKLILASPLPHMTPLFALLPIAAIHYSIKHYHLMQEIVEDKDDFILNNETRRKLYYYLSLAFMAGGALTFLSRFLSYMVSGEELLDSTLYASQLLFAFGFAILILQLIKSDQIKNFLITAIVLISIPMITLEFVEYAGITVWAFPMILMIVSFVFNARTPLILVTFVAIITQVIVWIYAPVKSMWVDKFDYVLRIGIFLIAFLVGSFVNKIYITKLKENNYQVDFQKMITKISFDFMSMNQTNIDEKISNSLQEIGHFFQADRAYLYLMSSQKSTMTNTHEWYSQSITPEIRTLQDIPVDVFPWWMEQLKSKKLVQPPPHNIKSGVAVPIMEAEELLGFIGFDSVLSFREWSDHHIQLLKILANLLADGLIKMNAEKKIERMAYYDQLTWLPNRTLFSDRLTQALHLAKETETSIGVMFMDLDNFKAVNDTVGHSGGDTLIMEVAQRLVGRVRETDIVARFGGDEFLVMINNTPEGTNILEFAENILGLFKKPFHINEQEFFITGSIGVAVYPFDGEDVETLIKNADTAMYRAKSLGKNQYALCTMDMKEEVHKNMMLSNSLHRALERDELVVHYQPQIRLQTGQIIGLEALLRWQHPDMGMISPSIFIPLAERNGLINSIGEWVLKTASSQIKKWQDMGLPHLRVAVNLSMRQFNNLLLVDHVDRILKEAGLGPEYLELEITESIATKETNHTVDILNKLKKLGVSIAIDDFGTKYSSLSRLKKLPIDRIKIDMQFVQGIEGSEKDRAITQVIINLAQSLGLEVLAEGVETSPQLEFLNQKMCDDVQGYYFYKPMPAEEIEKLLRSTTREEAK